MDREKTPKFGNSVTETYGAPMTAADRINLNLDPKNTITGSPMSVGDKDFGAAEREVEREARKARKDRERREKRE